MDLVSLHVLRKLCNPLENPPWPAKGSSKSFPDQVAVCLEQKTFESNPVPLGAPLNSHAARVAFLVNQQTPFEPIEIDVGVPGAGHMPKWIIEDGNHRLAAALYRNDAAIAAEIGGSLNHAAHLKLIKKSSINPVRLKIAKMNLK